MNKLNGCHNGPELRDTVLVQNGWDFFHVKGTFSRVARMKAIPNPMTKDCQYSLLTRNDPGCEGCRHKRADFPPGTDPGHPAATAGTVPPRRKRRPG